MDILKICFWTICCLAYALAAGRAIELPVSELLGDETWRVLAFLALIYAMIVVIKDDITPAYYRIKLRRLMENKE